MYKRLFTTNKENSIFIATIERVFSIIKLVETSIRNKIDE